MVIKNTLTDTIGQGVFVTSEITIINSNKLQGDF